MVLCQHARGDGTRTLEVVQSARHQRQGLPLSILVQVNVGIDVRGRRRRRIGSNIIAILEPKWLDRRGDGTRGRREHAMTRGWLVVGREEAIRASGMAGVSGVGDVDGRGVGLSSQSHGNAGDSWARSHDCERFEMDELQNRKKGQQ